MPVFSAERVVFYRERAAMMYDPLALGIGKHPLLKRTGRDSVVMALQSLLRVRPLQSLLRHFNMPKDIWLCQ